MCPFTIQLPYVNEYMSILIHGYIINRYTPPASARITPFISNSNSNALIRFTGMLVSITNVLICNPSGILPSRFTIRSSSSLKSGNNSRCTVFSVLGLLSHPMAFTKSSADVISTAWFFLIRLLQPMEYSSLHRPGKAKQVPAYNDALSRLRYKTQWLMIVDADEFMIVNGNKKISEFLKDYEKYAALAVNWVMYDYGGLLKKPEGLVLENYRTVHGKFHPKNLHVKSVINPRKVALCVNPHYCEYKGGNYAVNENFEKVVGPVTAVQSIDKIRLNHYYCKSYEEYEAKVARGLADSYFKYTIKKEDYAFDDATEDYVAGRFAGPVRSLMEKGV